DPTRGPGRLIATMSSGGSRSIECLYRAGLEGDESTQDVSMTHLMAVIELDALDPYWRDTNVITDTYLATDAVPAMPISLPWRLSGNTLGVRANILNDGDVEAWPVITITGPGEDPMLRNVSTDAYTALNITLGAGEQV